MPAVMIGNRVAVSVVFLRPDTGARQHLPGIAVFGAMADSRFNHRDHGFPGEPISPAAARVFVPADIVRMMPLALARVFVALKARAQQQMRPDVCIVVALEEIVVFPLEGVPDECARADVQHSGSPGYRAFGDPDRRVVEVDILGVRIRALRPAYEVAVLRFASIQRVRSGGKESADPRLAL